jgi:hypothetical protein
MVNFGLTVAIFARWLTIVPILVVFFTVVKGLDGGRDITGLSLNPTGVGPGCAEVDDSEVLVSF